MVIKPLPAYHGDCIFLSFPSNDMNRNILIDTGPSKNYGKKSHLNKELKRIKDSGEFVDLLIITHIDDDHIAGALKMFGDSKFDIALIKKVWFNTGELISEYFNEEKKGNRDVNLIASGFSELSAAQGNTLEHFLKSANLMPENIMKNRHIEYIDEAKITVLSPNDERLEKLNSNWVTEKTGIQKLGGHRDYNTPISELVNRPFIEDTSIPNGSSLAILVEVDDNKILLLGDAWPSSVEAELRNMGYSEDNLLKVDIVKISHHGSKKNTSSDLFKLLDCENFIISTDGSRHGLPNKESIARIIHGNIGKNTHIFFNYENNVTKKIFLPLDMEEYSFDYDFINSEIGIEL